MGFELLSAGTRQHQCRRFLRDDRGSSGVHDSIELATESDGRDQCRHGIDQRHAGCCHYRFLHAHQSTLTAMMTTRNHQRGLSLISLLIALTIGIFMLAGLFTLWLQTRNTFQAQGSLGQLQDNERVALTMMANTIQSAGYYPIKENYSVAPPTPLLSQTNAFPASSASSYSYTAPGQFITGTYGGATSSTTSDTIAARFMSDGDALDCLGQLQPKYTVVTNIYTVNAQGYLTCSVSATSSGGATTVTPAMAIVGGVSLLTAYYGVDPGNTGSVTQYMTASNVSGSSYWPYVRSVRVQLTFRNPLAGQSGQTLAVMPTVERVISLAQNTVSL
jgi:type IV pilus assembly protein PilW